MLFQMYGCAAILLAGCIYLSSGRAPLAFIGQLFDKSLFRRPRKLSSDAKTSPDLNIGRSWGTWTPDTTFDYPAVEPWHDFNVENVLPKPYRPFRWGPIYPINLGIMAMRWNDWLQLDNHYAKNTIIRKHRTELRGKKAERCLPGYLDHAEEVLAEMCSFLAARYPKSFIVTRATYDVNDRTTFGDSLVGVRGGAVTGIKNCITGDVYDFVELRREEGEDWNPMKYAGLLQQDDLAVMVEDVNGEYRFQAGSICTAGFWRLEDKIGHTLYEIHTDGRVPQFREKLKFSMERFFQKQKVTAPVQRHNYFFQVDDQLAWSDHTNGPEDCFDQATKAPFEGAAETQGLDFIPPTPADRFESIWFRTERQTLRRMPKTGCILFTVRWPIDVAKSKGGELYLDRLLPKLDELHQQQILDGTVQLDEQGEIVGKNERSYPF